ncbi:olfactory receptor 51E1-like [Aquarana catesbeiana]|uniref:olfactory receptor 51E1-like n=1 Tax=Aquarana catesbeiana TaxID=8400 RepID=UPI003CC93733
MSSSSKNVSVTFTNFLLVGLVEIESFGYLCAFLALALFSSTLFTSSMILYITWTEKSLHEPMYIFICLLVINSMLGNTSYLPKLAIDLLSGCSTISLTGCFFQSFGIQLYAWTELFTFTIMAFDRYLAVGHPLRYHILMTNLAAQKISFAIYSLNVVIITITISLTARLSFCGVNIQSVFCEIMSLQPLACTDITINVLFGTVWTLSMVVGCLGVILFCYIRTIMICMKLSAESSQKAIHTLVTHILAFSIYFTTFLFVIFRYRLNRGFSSATFDLIIPLIGTSIATSVNPLIYGIRTKALKEKFVWNFQKLCVKPKK